MRRQQVALWVILAGLGLMGAAGCRQQPKVDTAQIERGKTIFQDQCALCHDPASTEKKVGPGLKGLFRREKLENGTPVSEASIRENLDKGSENMPSFKDTLTQEEKDALIAFLKTL